MNETLIAMAVELAIYERAVKAEHDILAKKFAKNDLAIKKAAMPLHSRILNKAVNFIKNL